jgi:hypothetical protein
LRYLPTIGFANMYVPSFNYIALLILGKDISRGVARPFKVLSTQVCPERRDSFEEERCPLSP